jgi:ATP-dependent Clp protease protease subunit
MSTPHPIFALVGAPFPKAEKWFEFRNVAKTSADLYLYEVIGDSWIGTDAASLVKEIKAQKGKKLNVRINSPGGSVFDGVAIYNALKAHDAEVVVYIDGYAASIASIIALAGTKVIIADNAMMMIHNPWTYASGEAKEMRRIADMLDQVKETLLNTYETKTKKKREKISDDMDAETWFTAKEALAYGLADQIGEALQLAACAPEALRIFAKADKIPSTTLTAVSGREVRARKLSLKEKQLAVL